MPDGASALGFLNSANYGPTVPASEWQRSVIRASLIRAFHGRRAPCWAVTFKLLSLRAFCLEWHLRLVLLEAQGS
jgi:hypothetical protein